MRHVIDRAIAIILGCALCQGCATRRIDFTSAPKGATVQVGQLQSITPCTLNVPEGATHARFLLPSGEILNLPLPKRDNAVEESSDGAREALGGTMKFTGVVVGAVGLVSLALWSVLEDEEDNDITSDDNGSDKLGFLGLTALISGVALIGLGEWIEPTEIFPVLHADFGWSEDRLYESDDFGVKRMRDFGTSGESP